MLSNLTYPIIRVKTYQSIARNWNTIYYLENCHHDHHYFSTHFWFLSSKSIIPWLLSAQESSILPICLAFILKLSWLGRMVNIFCLLASDVFWTFLILFPKICKLTLKILWIGEQLIAILKEPHKADQNSTRKQLPHCLADFLTFSVETKPHVTQNISNQYQSFYIILLALAP